MRRKRKLFYTVSPMDNWWWTPGKRRWMKFEDRVGCAASSNRDCRTFDQAMRTAKLVPTGEVIITQWVWRKGHRSCRDYYFRREKS